MRAAITRNLPRIFLYLLLIFVPVQLGPYLGARPGHVLTHDMLVFSIYQHRQYVPVIFVSAYLLALFSLVDRPSATPGLVGSARDERLRGDVLFSAGALLLCLAPAC